MVTTCIFIHGILQALTPSLSMSDDPSCEGPKIYIFIGLVKDQAFLMNRLEDDRDHKQ